MASRRLAAASDARARAGAWRRRFLRNPHALSLSPYRCALRVPHARAAFAASLLQGRLTYGTVSLSLILTLTAGGRGYGLGGLVLGAVRRGGRAARRRCAPRWSTATGRAARCPPMAAGFGAALTALAVLFPAGSGGLARPAAPCWPPLCSACAPPLGVVMRALWGALAEGSGTAAWAAYSLDGVAEELLYRDGAAARRG